MSFDPRNPQVGDRFVWTPGIEPPRKATVQRVSDQTVTMLRDGKVQTDVIERGAFATYAKVMRS